MANKTTLFRMFLNRNTGRVFFSILLRISVGTIKETKLYFAKKKGTKKTIKKYNKRTQVVLYLKAVAFPSSHS